MKKETEISSKIIDALNDNLFNGLLIKCETCRYSNNNTWGYTYCKSKKREKCIRYNKWSPNDRIKNTVQHIQKIILEE